MAEVRIVCARLCQRISMDTVRTKLSMLKLFCAETWKCVATDSCGVTWCIWYA